MLTLASRTRTAKNDDVSTVILGASKTEQVIENLKAIDVIPKLTPEVLEKIGEQRRVTRCASALGKQVTEADKRLSIHAIYREGTGQQARARQHLRSLEEEAPRCGGCYSRLRALLSCADSRYRLSLLLLAYNTTLSSMHNA